MGPQHLILYSKKIIIRLGDEIWAINWLGHYPKAHILLQLLWVYAGCNGVASIHMREVVVKLVYIHGQSWCRERTSSKKKNLRRVIKYWLGKNSN
jgi:hypothetical protein